MIKKKEIWGSVTKSLRSALPDSDFRTWFSQTNLLGIDQDRAVIEVPNKFIASWLRDKYSTRIRDSFKESVGLNPSIHFIYPDIEKTTKAPQNPGLNFENFIVSDCNLFAYHSASEVADKPGGYYNPLYVFGNSGVGKSHILNGIGNKINKYNPLARITYLSADDFRHDLDTAKKEGNVNEFRSKFIDLDCLLLDDIHFFADSIKPQEELIMLFDSYHKSRTQIAMAGKFPPSHTSGLISSLKSRMEWGLLAEVEPPDEKVKKEFIDRKLRNEGLSVPEDVLFFLINSTNDLNILNGYIANIIDVSKFGKRREVNLSTVKSIIKSKKKDGIDVNEIQRTTAKYFNISLSNLVSNEKRRDYSYPRQIAMYLSRELIDLSYTDIGKNFGKKDHSTIIYAIKKIKEQKSKNKRIVNHLKDLTNLLT